MEREQKCGDLFHSLMRFVFVCCLCDWNGTGRRNGANAGQQGQRKDRKRSLVFMRNPEFGLSYLDGAVLELAGDVQAVGRGRDGGCLEGSRVIRDHGEGLGFGGRDAGRPQEQWILGRRAAGEGEAFHVRSQA